MAKASIQVDGVRSTSTLTKHAATRMQQRGLSVRHVEAALTYGRRLHAKGLTYFVVGRKEVRTYSAKGVDLAPYAGVQVLVSADGSVVTTYRSHDLHGIRATRRPRRHFH